MESTVSFSHFTNNTTHFSCKRIEEKVAKAESTFYKIYFYVLYYRRITKMDKLTGLKVSFMLEYPELGRLDNLDVYTDEIPGGKILLYL